MLFDQEKARVRYRIDNKNRNSSFQLLYFNDYIENA